jgi:hypothetical protein
MKIFVNFTLNVLKLTQNWIKEKTYNKLLFFNNSRKPSKIKNIKSLTNFTQKSLKCIKKTKEKI